METIGIKIIHNIMVLNETKRYIARQSGGSWTKDNVLSAVVMSRLLLWNVPPLKDSTKDANERFNVKLILI